MASVRGVGRRARIAVRRVQGQLRGARSTHRTVHRDLHDVPAPRPSHFHHFGSGSWIVPPARVRGAPAISVGDGVIIMEESSITVLGDRPSTADPLLVIGDRVRLARFNTIHCEVGIEIGDDVAGSDNVAISDTWSRTDAPGAGPGGLRNPPPAAVVIERRAYLGCGSIILPGVRVGEGAFVGEGAVVWDDVPPHSVVYGNPAVVTRRFDPAEGRWKGPRWP